jgi:uncharacterized membrane protein YcaP (DUF421 family)
METKVLHDMFWLGVPVMEKMLRPIVVYLFLILSLRLAGKRELAQLNPFDLVVLLTISNTVQNAIIGEDNTVTGGLIGAATLLVVNHVVVRYLYGHERLERLVEGAPDTLIDNGEIQMDRLRDELITEGELLSAAHKQGFATLSEIDRAVLEPGGTMVFLAKKPPSEVQRHDRVMEKLDQLAAELAALRAAR